MKCDIPDFLKKSGILQPIKINVGNYKLDIFLIVSPQ